MGILRTERRSEQKGDGGSDTSYHELLEQRERLHRSYCVIVVRSCGKTHSRADVTALVRIACAVDDAKPATLLCEEHIVG